MSGNRFLALAVALVISSTAAATDTCASRLAVEFSATLSSAEKTTFEEYIAAQTLYDFRLDKYWRSVSDKRAQRRRKRGKGLEFTVSDYVESYPPEYSGPTLPSGLAKRWYAFRTKDEKKRPPRKPMAGVSDFLANAKRYYGFVPERIPEREFKRRYAAEALERGLTKEQVVRVYALETGGLGTADMQAGIHPIRKTGKPISSALGYAQLLAANSINELVKHGPKFIQRLESMTARTSSPERTQQLRAKTAALRKMYASAKSVPFDWSRQVAYSTTAKGNGIHALNIDGDIGPWLQVIKLDGLKETARKRGKNALTSAEIELMNLAGPGTGLEMMMPVGRKMPTPNFFERGGYERNTIVRGKTSQGLLEALHARMEANMDNSGAREFVEVFNELLAAQRAAN